MGVQEGGWGGGGGRGHLSSLNLLLEVGTWITVVCRREQPKLTPVFDHDLSMLL